MSKYQELPWNNEIEFYDLHSKDIFSKFPFYHLSMIGKTKEEFASYIIDKCDINHDSVVIDAGCGGGYLTHTINNICKVVGISTSEECIKQAKLNYPDTEFEVGNMETFCKRNMLQHPRPCTHFLCLESLHYSDIKKTFQNAYNNLKPGGLFYMKEWYRNYKETDINKINRKHWSHYFKYNAYTIPHIIQLGYDVGFTLISAQDLSGHTNSVMYGESEQYHKEQLVIPYAGDTFIFPGELMFIKEGVI